MISAWWLLLLVPNFIIFCFVIFDLIKCIVEEHVERKREFREGMVYAYEHPYLKDVTLGFSKRMKEKERKETK